MSGTLITFVFRPKSSSVLCDLNEQPVDVIHSMLLKIAIEPLSSDLQRLNHGKNRLLELLIWFITIAQVLFSYGLNDIDLDENK